MKNVAKYATGLNLIYVVLICRDSFKTILIFLSRIFSNILDSAQVLNDLSNCKPNYDYV